MRWNYSLLLMATFLLPFLYSIIHRRYLGQDYKYSPLLLTVFIVAVPFIIIDIIATRAGWWHFNAQNITGITIFGLPFEELLFFIAIPQSCLFMWIFIRPDNAWPRFKRVLTHHYRSWRQ